ncbi:MAG: outer membrane beta-barrel protein [Cyclobacteriaceae bacterium]
MTKRSVVVFILTLMVVGSVSAQEKQKKVYRPDIPGSFMIDFGFNTGFSTPQNFSYGTWGSRTLNLYYHYPVRIGQSNFTYNPGAGFSFERFKLTNNYTLMPQPSSTDGTYIIDNPASVTSPIGFLQGASIKKSMLVANYFDVMPIEFRFDSNPKDLARSFNFSIGARVGALIESHTKIKYSNTNGVSGTFKDKQQHGLNPFRYGLYGRIGVGNFNWFCFYNLSPYFDTGKGPHNSTTDQRSSSMNTMTIGISLNGF